MICASARATAAPMQMRGPAPNGMYAPPDVQGEVWFEERSKAFTLFSLAVGDGYELQTSPMRLAWSYAVVDADLLPPHHDPSVVMRTVDRPGIDELGDR